MAEENPEWASDLKKELGDDLRMATEYNDAEYKYLYIRDDLEQKYSDTELESFRREMIVLMLGKDRIEEITHVGELFGITHWLDGAAVFQFFTGKGEFDGYFVSVEPEATEKQDYIRTVLTPQG